MEIRTFKNSDSSQIKDLINNVLREEYPEAQGVFPGEGLDNLSKSYSGTREALLVAEESGRIIGVISIKEETPQAALIRELFVHKDYRRRNYGQALLRRAVDFSRIKGYKGLLFRSTSRMQAALNLCLKNGFKVTNEKDLGEIPIVELSLKIENQ
jgi:GNAT superfamily N-acetyltransferase